MAALQCPGCGAGAAPQSSRCAYCGLTLAVESCAACLGMLFIGSRHCAHCGAQTAKPEVRGEGDAARPCPRCAERPALEVRRVGEIELEQCPSCTGVFVGPRTLDALVSSKDRAAGLAEGPQGSAPMGAPTPDRVVYLPCPACAQPMMRTNFGRRSGVIVDVCKPHGTWFDADELRRVAAFVAKGGLDETRRREIEELERKIADRRTQAIVNPTRAYDPEIPSKIDFVGGVIDLLRLIF